MRLTRLAATGFRNLSDVHIDTSKQFVVLSGRNAQGKTNCLEAVYTLATLRPLRGHRVRDLVCWGEDQATVVGELLAEDGRRQLRVDFGAKRRKVSLDGDEVRDLGRYFAEIRVIGFTPQDGGIITGEPERRRRWLDRAAFTANPVHLMRVRTYQRVLKQKGAALREDQPDLHLVRALNEQLAQAGGRLAYHRLRMLSELAPHIASQHAQLAGSGGSLRLHYRTACEGQDPDTCASSLYDALDASLDRERQRRMCLVGPQKDNIQVTLDGRAMRHFGSRGQVRSLVLSMKLAELIAARARDERPLFLLDDLSSELDDRRTSALVEQLMELQAQVFITTTDVSHLSRLPEEEACWFQVSEGRVEAATRTA